MTTQQDQAQRIQATINTPGWLDIVRLLDEMAASSKDDLFEIMTKRPEKLTGRIAIAKANRADALIEFKEELYALVAPLNPKGQGK